MAEKLNGKRNIIIIIIIALLGFLLLSLSGEPSEEDESLLPINDATTTPESEVLEEPELESEDDDNASRDVTESLPESSVPIDETLGTGGPVIIGYDEEKFPIYGEAQPETDLAPPQQSMADDEMSLITAGQSLLEELDTTLAVLYHHRGLVYREIGMTDVASRDFARADELGYDPSQGVW